MHISTHSVCLRDNLLRTSNIPTHQSQMDFLQNNLFRIDLLVVSAIEGRY